MSERGTGQQQRKQVGDKSEGDTRQAGLCKHSPVPSRVGYFERSSGCFGRGGPILPRAQQNSTYTRYGTDYARRVTELPSCSHMRVRYVHSSSYLGSIRGNAAIESCAATVQRPPSQRNCSDAARRLKRRPSLRFGEGKAIWAGAQSDPWRREESDRGWAWAYARGRRLADKGGNGLQAGPCQAAVAFARGRNPNTCARVH